MAVPGLLVTACTMEGKNDDVADVSLEKDCDEGAVLDCNDVEDLL